MGRCSKKKLQKIDMFGTSLPLTYKNKATYTTSCGSVMTIIAVSGYLVLLGLKLMEFFGQSDPVRHSTVQAASQDRSLDLNEIGFTFAVENVATEIGQLEAH